MKSMLKKIKKGDVIFYAVFIFLLICIRSSVFASYHVPTPSMNPTILEGDVFFANKLAYRLKIPFTKISIVEWSQPKRGELVVFKFPEDESELYTKRIIGVPGDVISIRNKQFIINGKPVPQTKIDLDDGKELREETLDGETYTIQTTRQRTRADNMEPVTVPEGFVYAIGDNRDNSYDSRYWGFLPMENIEGKLFVRWFSWDHDKYLPRLDRIGLI